MLLTMQPISLLYTKWAYYKKGFAI